LAALEEIVEKECKATGTPTPWEQGVPRIAEKEICDERITYLKSFVPAGVSRISYHIWRMHYTKEQADRQMDFEYNRMKLMEYHIKDFKKSMDEGKISKSMSSIEKLNLMISEYEHLRAKWEHLNIEQQKNDIKLYDINKPKKIEITDDRKGDIHDMRRIFAESLKSKKVIDVESESSNIKEGGNNGAA
jgi:hypothetical protein